LKQATKKQWKRIDRFHSGLKYHKAFEKLSQFVGMIIKYLLVAREHQRLFFQWLTKAFCPRASFLWEFIWTFLTLIQFSICECIKF
jgi:hypothetical protein